MWWNAPGMNGWGFAIMSIWTVLVAALVVSGLVAAARILRATPDRPTQVRLAPEDLFAERFARGEIDEQEYRQGLETLRSVRRTGIDSPPRR